MINIIEADNDGGEYAGGGKYADGGKYVDEVLLFSINPTDYTRKKVLAMPRCCQRVSIPFAFRQIKHIFGIFGENNSEFRPVVFIAKGDKHHVLLRP